MPGMPDATAPSKELTITPLPPKKPFVPSLRYPSNRKTIYDRNLNRTKTSEISLASFSGISVAQITMHYIRLLSANYGLYFASIRRASQEYVFDFMVVGRCELSPSRWLSAVQLRPAPSQHVAHRFTCRSIFAALSSL